MNDGPEQGENGIEDLNVLGYSTLISPYHIKRQVPLTDKAEKTVREGRRGIREILNGDRKRLMMAVGPCSIHDVEAAKEYAERLAGLKDRVKDRIEIVMRTYFEKPRTIIGWKGLVYEPRLDGQERINEGLITARELLMFTSELGLPAGTEFLDTFTPQYIADVISWGAIGARTVESQIHRQLASGLSMPIGFKNGTQGDVSIAVNAVISARNGHSFLGIDQYGLPSVVRTRGNKYAHIMLRGGDKGPNYDRDSVKGAQETLRKAGLPDGLMIDCSHGNSNKDYRKQPGVFEDVIGQIAEGNDGIIGIMLESNINEGSQKVVDPKNLKYGVSITDSCIGWDTTEKLVYEAYKSLK